MAAKFTGSNLVTFGGGLGGVILGVVCERPLRHSTIQERVTKAGLDVERTSREIDRIFVVLRVGETERVVVEDRCSSHSGADRLFSVRVRRVVFAQGCITERLASGGLAVLRVGFAEI